MSRPTAWRLSLPLRTGDMSLFYWTTMIFLRWLLRRVFRCQVRGLENIPAGGALIVGNHVSVLDPEFICAAARGHDLSWLAKKPLFEIPVIGLCLRWLRTIPLNQDGADITAFREALARMERGNLVGIFPEGGIPRPGEHRVPSPGVAVLGHMAQKPVVPVGVSGLRPLYRWKGWLPVPSVVWIRFGQPLDPPSGPRLNKESRQRFADRCMLAITELVRANEEEEAALLATRDRQIPASRV